MNENTSNRTMFKRNFLKKISCVCTLENASWSLEIKSKISNLLKEKGFKIVESGELPVVQANMNSINMLFSSSVLVIATDIKGYDNFEHFLEYIHLSIHMLQVMECSVIKSFLYQKENQYNINLKHSGQKITEDQFFKLLFSKKLLDNLPLGLFEKTNQRILFSQTAFEEDEKENKVSATLTLGAIHAESMQVSEWVKQMTSLNQALFNMWMEATSESIRNVMKQEKA